MNPVLSIIVPVSTMDQNIGTFLKGLKDQDLEKNEFEVIAVIERNERSWDMACMWQLEYPDLQYVKQTKEGIGGARNAGIIHSKGKYVMFIDPQDRLASQCLKTVIGEMEKHDLDVLYTGTQKESTEVLPGMESIIRKEFTESIRGCMYRKEIITRNGIYFTQEKYYEDTDFNLRVLFFSERVKYLNYRFYHHQAAQAREDALSPQQLDDLMTMCEKTYYYFAPLVSDLPQQKRAISNYLYNRMYWFIGKLYETTPYENMEEWHKRLKKNQLFLFLAENSSLTRKGKMKLMYHSPSTIGFCVRTSRYVSRSFDSLRKMPLKSGMTNKITLLSNV